jgi:hypothetical protein
MRQELLTTDFNKIIINKLDNLDRINLELPYLGTVS